MKIILVSYTLREFGELGIGEKHCIFPNNVIKLMRSLDTEESTHVNEKEEIEGLTPSMSSSNEFRKMGDR